MHYVNSAPFHMVDHSYSPSSAHTVQIALEPGFNRSTTEHFGVPDGTPYAIVLGRLFKLHPSFDNILFDILQSSSGYIVVIAEATPEWNELVYQRWKEYAWRHSMHSLLRRIVFTHYDYYVDALLRAKVVLDTYPYGGQS